MSRNSDVVSTDTLELEALPPEAQAFHRRARIVDAAVREIAEHGYGQVTVAGIAERGRLAPRLLRDLRGQAGRPDLGLRRGGRVRHPADPRRAVRRARLGAGRGVGAEYLPGDPRLRP
jgi:hypothetical protein